MLINKNTKIIGNKVILIPYRQEHVPKYHEWMKSEELQYLTASEPLTIDEEYEMQQSWLQDENKCTFIILDKQKFMQTSDEIESMIGDTNLFFISNPFDEEPSALVSEAEIMIAEQWARGNHRGFEAILIMLNYGIEVLNVLHYVVKITSDNLISLKMFEKIGFIRTSFSSTFNQVTMEKIVDENFKKSLNINYEIMHYE